MSMLLDDILIQKAFKAIYDVSHLSFRFLINVNHIKLYELRIQIFSKSNKNQHVKALANNGV